MIELVRYIIENKPKICEHILKYDKQYDLIKYYDGDINAWFIPVDAISKHLCELILEDNPSSIYDYKTNDKYKLISDAGIGNILKFYGSKIDLGIFLCTMKCYKLSYIDLINEAGFDSDKKLSYIDIVSRIFDHLEVYACSQWNKTSNSEIKFNTLSEITSALVFMHDFDEIIYVNPAVEEFTGYSNEELIKMNLKKFIHPFFLDKLSESIKRREISSSAQEIKVVTRDNIEKWLEFNQGYIYFADKPIVLGVAFDITKRKKAEAENLKLQQTIEYDNLKTELFNNLSHEFRTPLNLILSSIQLLDLFKDQEEKIDFHKYTSVIKQNSYRLNKLVNNLLDITSINSQSMNTCFETDNIIPFIEDITLSALHYAENKDISIVFDTELEEIMIAFDKSKLERVLLNLLSNSIKYTPRGGSIFVTVYEGKNSLILSLKDTGVGIPLEEQKNIFDKFTQVDKSLSRLQEGSGVGLSIVKAFVEIHGGAVSINNEYTDGCEIIIELPTSLSPSDECGKHRNLVDKSSIKQVHIEFSDLY